MAFPRVATETERRGHKYPEPRAREPMASTRAWGQRRRVKHRDAIALCAVSAAFLLAGELTAPIFGEVYATHLAPFLDRPTEFVLRTVLAIFAFTTPFGAGRGDGFSSASGSVSRASASRASSRTGPSPRGRRSRTSSASRRLSRGSASSSGSRPTHIRK